MKESEQGLVREAARPGQEGPARVVAQCQVALAICCAPIMRGARGVLRLFILQCAVGCAPP